MILDITGDIPFGEVFILTINGEEKELCGGDTAIQFDLQSKCKYTIHFRQKEKYYMNRLGSIMLFIFTIIIQGIFNILLLNVSSDWYNSIQPYYMKGRFVYECKNHSSICLKYCPAKYNQSDRTWTKPRLLVSNCDEIYFDYSNNLADFGYQYYAYAKKLISIGFVALSLFVTLLVAAYANKIFAGLIILIALIILVFFLVILLLITQYRKMQAMFNDFVIQESMDHV